MNDEQQHVTVCDSVKTAATSFTSCDHLLCGYTRLFCLIPSIDLSLSPVFPLSPPPSLMAPLVLLPSSALCSLFFVQLSSALPQELPSYTECVSGVFRKPRLFGSLFMCKLHSFTAVYCQGAETTLKIKPIHRFLQETPKKPSSFLSLALIMMWRK